MAGLSPDQLGDPAVLGGQRRAAVDHQQGQVGAGQRGAAALHAQVFGQVARVAADARRVDQHQGDAAQVERLLQRVARGAGDGGDDGPLGAQQGVEQAALAHVGLADDGRADALAVDDALLGAVDQSLKRSLGRLQLVVDGIGRDLVLVKVDAGLDPGQGLQQAGACVAGCGARDGPPTGPRPGAARRRSWPRPGRPPPRPGPGRRAR